MILAIQKLIKRAFSLIFLLLLGSGAFLTVHKVKGDQLVVIKDKRIDRNIGLASENYNFVWQGALPFWYSVYKTPSQFSVDTAASIPIPPLNSDKSNEYSIQIPVSVVFKVQKDELKDIQLLDNTGTALETRIVSYINGYFSESLFAYLSPNYRPGRVRNNVEKIIKETNKRLAEKLKSQGIELISLKSAGAITLPSQNEYREGVQHFSAIQALVRKNELKDEMRKYMLKKKKHDDSEELKKLESISKLIQENPDILKYMYIDKLGANVKVIISSDKSGMPVFLNSKDEIEDKANTSGEIDNLR